MTELKLNTGNGEENKNRCVRTTVYLPKSIHMKVKQLALWTNTSFSCFVRVALRDKIKEVESQIKDYKTKN